jgi:hypothetical protein
MPRAAYEASDFTDGEVSPRYIGRIDQALYRKGALLMSNFMSMKQGGFRKRPGTLYVGKTHNNHTARLVPIIVSSTVAYIAEFTDSSISFWRNDQVVTTIASTYAAADLNTLQFAWVYPDLFIAHASYAPARIRWTTPNTFTLSTLQITTATYNFTGDVANGTNTILNVPITTQNLTPGLIVTGTGLAANQTITSIAVVQGTGGLPNTLTLTLSANATGGGVGQANVAVLPFSVPPSTLVKTGFSGAGNYPSCVAAAFQRVWWGGTTYQPATFWSSVIGIWDTTDPGGTTGIMCFKWTEQVNYVIKTVQTDANGNPTANPPVYLATPTCRQVIADNDSITFTIADTNESIQWITAARDLFVGTASGEWVIPGGATPSTVSVSLVSKTGSTAIQGAMLNGGLVFVGQAGRRVFQLNWQGSANVTPPPIDLSMFSEHLFTTNPIVAFDYQQIPDYVLWFVLADGTMVSLLLDSAFQVQAWSRFVMPSGTITGVAVIPGSTSDAILPDAGRDVVYISVLYNAQNYVEKLSTPDWTDQRKAVYSDHSVYKYNAVAFNTVAVDSTFNGVVFSVIGDGAYLGTATVAAGSLTIPAGKTVNYAVVGTAWTSQCQLFPVDVSGGAVAWGGGTSVLMVKGTAQPHVRFYKTLDASAQEGTAFDGSVLLGTAQAYSLGGVDVTTAIPTLFSGDDKTPYMSSFDTLGMFNILSTKPLPCMVTAIVVEIEVTQ